MKIRIFALAKELGIDNKLLIQYCNEAGLDVKASPLASISLEERDRVLEHMQKVQPTGPRGARESLSPVRDAPPDRAKTVRPIRTLGPLGGTLRTRRGRGGEAEEAPDEDGSLPSEGATDDAAPFDELPATAVAEAPARPEPPTGGGGEKARPAPISRSDYVAPTGAGLSGIREMKPRASIREAEPRARREKSRKAPSLPSVATPTFKPPTPGGRSAGPVQKPDMPLTAELLKQSSPLAGILKKHKDDSKKQRGIVTEVVEEEAPSRKSRAGSLGLVEGREERRRKRQRTRGGESEEEVETAVVTRVPKRHKRSGPVALKTAAAVMLPMTIRDFSLELGRPARDIISILFRTGRMVTINDLLDEETALEVALDLGIDLMVEKPKDIDDLLAERAAFPNEDLGMPLLPRPPIVTILGHVDHGKTTLIDRFRSSNVAAGEAGGITQHIAAYQVEHNGHKLTFVDTPGHAAFGEMRARGANVTDIVVLVVAGDDGVMPQTQECISHAKAAGVPMVVALNKMDLPGVNEQKILTELSQHDVLPAEWGGDTEVVRISALKGTGIDNLLETLLVTAELREFNAPPDMPAEGVCLEAFRDEGLGPLAWLIVRRGTLRIGDVMVCGTAFGRVRSMYADRGQELTEAGPSTPIKVAGLDVVPGAGDHFFVMDDLDQAREVAEWRRQRGRTETLTLRGGPKTLEQFFADSDGSVRELPLIVKADTPGSIEALRHELDKFEHPEVKVKTLHYGVGGVNESDVALAASAGAIVVAFHVVPEDRAELMAQRDGVEIRRYNIIYNVTDEIKLALEGLLAPERVEVSTGRALVLRTFSISRIGTIAGCRVLNGTIERNNRVHVIRDQKILNDYPIASLKREKDDVREVRDGLECGIRLEGFDDVKEGDLLEAFRIEERKRTLDGDR